MITVILLVLKLKYVMDTFMKKVFGRQPKCSVIRKKSYRFGLNDSFSSEASTTSCTSMEEMQTDSRPKTNGYYVDKNIISTRKKLKTKFTKYRRRDDALQRKKQLLLLMHEEIEELMRRIEITNARIKAVDQEIANKKLEVDAMSKDVSEKNEAELKKKIPIYFKKYSNAKTAADAKTVLNSVRVRQVALHQLELLVYMKYLKLSRDVKTEVPKDAVSSFHAGTTLLDGILGNMMRNVFPANLPNAQAGLDNVAFESTI